MLSDVEIGQEPAVEDAQSQAEERGFAAFVHLGYGFGAAGYRARYAAGLVPDATPYGLHHAADMNCSVAHSVDHPESALGRMHRRCWNKLLGFDIVHAYRNRKAMEAADVIWTMEERQYLAVLLLGVVRPHLAARKLIAQTVWLFDRWTGEAASSMAAPRRWLLRRLLARAAALTVHSRRYLALPELGRFREQMRLLPFGISLDSFPHSAEVRPRHQPVRVLAMGNDPTRDWATLLEALGNDSRFEVIAISQRLTPETVARYRNVKTWQNPQMEDFRACYRWADFAVVPMTPNLYSGITVALEATSMGVPVVSSATGGVDTYFDPAEVLYVPPLDAEALRNSLLACGDEARDALVRSAQSRFKREDYSTRGMAARYVALSRALLSEVE